MFTNPMMYKNIKQHKTTLALYTERLVRDGLIPEGEIEDMKAAFQAKMNDEFEAGRDYKPNKADWLDGRWSHLDREKDDYQRGQTSISDETLSTVGKALTTAPEGLPFIKPWHVCWIPNQKCLKAVKGSIGPQPKPLHSDPC